MTTSRVYYTGQHFVQIYIYQNYLNIVVMDKHCTIIYYETHISNDDLKLHPLIKNIYQLFQYLDIGLSNDDDIVLLTHAINKHVYVMNLDIDLVYSHDNFKIILA